MPCYRAQSHHFSTADTRPQTGASWTTYWKECPCCSSSSPSSSSSTSPSTSPSPPSSSSSYSSSSVTENSQTPSVSSSSSFSSSTSPSTSGGTSSSASAHYVKYVAYNCTGNDFNGINSCDSWYALSGGVDMEVLSTNETHSSLWPCSQADGSTIEYKICKVNGIGAFGASACALLITKSSLTNPYPAGVTHTGNGYQSCYDCTLNPITKID
jgi:hypothetical protein